MSISINENRNLVITSAAKAMSYDDAIIRLESLINVLQCTNMEMLQQADLYNVCEIILDMLPDKELLYNLSGQKPTL